MHSNGKVNYMILYGGLQQINSTTIKRRSSNSDCVKKNSIEYFFVLPNSNKVTQEDHQTENLFSC